MSRMNKILKQMTLREKLSQLTQLDSSFFLKYGSSELTGPLHEMNIQKQDVASCGSVLGGIGAEITTKIQEEHLKTDRNKIPLLFMLDVIHGFRTIFPINLAMACSWEPEALEEAMSISAKEAAASGVHVTFAPMADLVRDARWGRVMESTGEDPYLNALYAAAAVHGFQGKNLANTDRLASCIKHIAGYGAAEAGRDYNTTEIGKNSLFEFYMPAYRAAIDAGCVMGMTAFNALNGIPCTANKWLLKDVLRGDWQFNGTIISDWGAVGELTKHGVAEGGYDAAGLALSAGVDIEMMTSNYLQYGEKLVADGMISESEIDAAVLRILELKEKLGLFDNPYHGASVENEKRLLNCEEHRKAAYEMACKSMVLLENDGVLPLNPNAKIAFVGPYADNQDLIGGWACTGRIEETISIRQAVADKNYIFDAGCGITEKAAYPFSVLLDKLQDADVIVLALGESSDMSGEAASRTDISLPQCQLELLHMVKTLGKPIATVIFSGRPLLLKDVAQNSNALLQAWFPGSEGGNAVRDLLFGFRKPEGRLTISFPYCNGQIPNYYNHFSTGRPIDQEYSEKRYLSRYIDAPNAPLYPFGYGLGYSTTRYSALEVTAFEQGIEASVEVTNTGMSEITETVQLYIRDVCAPVVRPVKQLKAFKKIFLAKGEKCKVTFLLKRDELSYYMEDGQKHFDPGTFSIMIGPNSRDVLKKDIMVGE